MSYSTDDLIALDCCACDILNSSVGSTRRNDALLKAAGIVYDPELHPAPAPLLPGWELFIEELAKALRFEVADFTYFDCKYIFEHFDPEAE